MLMAITRAMAIPMMGMITDESTAGQPLGIGGSVHSHDYLHLPPAKRTGGALITCNDVH